MKIIRNFVLLMLIVFIFQLGFNGCINLLKNYILKNITVSYEDKSENILEKHKLFYGTIGAWAAYRNKKDIQKGYKNGVLAGEIAYLGKKIARKRGLGLIGQVVHSIGVSMLENQILNKPLFSRYKIFLPPASLEFGIQEGVSCKFLLGSLVGISANVIGLERMAYFEPSEIDEKKLWLISAIIARAFISPRYFLISLIRDNGESFKPIDSLINGTPIFIFKKNKDKKEQSIDMPCNIGGVIAVDQEFFDYSHEMIHGCQYREAAILNLFIERRFFRGFPLLFSQDLAYIFYILSEEFKDLVEEEPGEYDRIYEFKSKMPFLKK